MSVYRDELLDAERNGQAAYEAMDQWVSRPPEAHDDMPGAVLEGYARDLRESRERLLKLLAGHGNRDDIVEALAKIRSSQNTAAVRMAVRVGTRENSIDDDVDGTGEAADFRAA